jgi:hypothetical protein
VDLQPLHGQLARVPQAFTATGAPAYADPASGAYNRPLWRPTWRYD